MFQNVILLLRRYGLQQLRHIGNTLLRSRCNSWMPSYKFEKILDLLEKYSDRLQHNRRSNPRTSLVEADEIYNEKMYNNPDARPIKWLEVSQNLLLFSEKGFEMQGLLHQIEFVHICDLKAFNNFKVNYINTFCFLLPWKTFL